MEDENIVNNLVVSAKSIGSFQRRVDQFTVGIDSWICFMQCVCITYGRGGLLLLPLSAYVHVSKEKNI